MCQKSVRKKVGGRICLLSLLILLIAIVLSSPSSAVEHSGFNDCAIDWNNFQSAPGYIADYTYKGQAIRDHESVGSGDPSHGQANVPPEETDLASGATAGINPGGYTTPYFGYYDGGTQYDPLIPSTMADDYIFFRMRVSGDPKTNKVDYKSYHWNVLFDVDADGYKEYWIDIDGNYSSTSKDYDRIQILYDNRNDQELDPEAPGVRVAYFRAYNAVDTANCGTLGYSHTRVIQINDGTGDYWIEEQIPMTAFKDSNGNQVLFPDSPVAFVFSTGASNQDPLQKDWMMDLNWLSNADPITFGDIIIPQGTPIIDFADSALNFVSLYSIGDNIFVYVNDRFANNNPGSGETIQVTITDPNTGDDEVLTLHETGNSTGIFTNKLSGTQLSTANWDGNNVDNDHVLEIASKDAIYVSYTNENAYTVTDQAVMLGPCDVIIEFTRANGLPSNNFILTNDVDTSDKLYVTTTDSSANTDPNTRQTITVNLSGNDTQSLTLTETGNNTGVFRNTTGLNSLIESPPVVANDGTWEDNDAGDVTATYDYACGGSQHNESTTAILFATAEGGRVFFTNASGTQDVTLYGPDQNVYIKVIDGNNCGTTVPKTITVTVTNSGNTDSDAVMLTETVAGSCIYLNTGDSLRTKTYDGVYVPDDGWLEVANGATITVIYTDTNDGDNDRTNDEKKDTATYNAPSVVINEVLFFPGQVNNTNCVMEYVQLHNATPSNVDVTGYVITDGDTFNYTIPQFNGSNLILQPGEKIYVSLYEIVPADRYDSVNKAYYLFAQANKKYCSNDQKTSCSSDTDCSAGFSCISFPSIEFGDPLDADPADQMLLHNSHGELIDYVGWSATLNPSVDFLGDDSPAVAANIWQDDAFINISSISPDWSVKRTSDGYDSNSPTDWSYNQTGEGCNLIVTRAVISSFAGHSENGKVVIEWKTASEAGTVGFYLYRKDDLTGEYVQANQKLLPAILTSRRGGEYHFVDEGAAPGFVYTYLLVEVESSGKTHTYGPYQINTHELRTVSGHKAFTNAGYGRKEHDITEAKRNRLTAAASQKPTPDSRGSLDPVYPPPSDPAPPASDPVPPLWAAGSNTKVAIKENGLYYLDKAILSPLLGNDALKMRGNRMKLQITNQGREIPYLISDDKAGIYFYGQGMNDMYTDKNVYWLEETMGKQMDVLSGTGPVPFDGNAMFLETIHREEDSWTATALFTNPESDYWLWDYVVADDPDFGAASFTIEAKGIAPTSQDTNLTVNLHGATATDHHAIVSINGVVAGESTWFGAKAHSFTVSFEQSCLREGDNRITVTGLLDSGVPYSIFYVDSFDLVYHRLYEAVNDRLFFRGDGNPVVTVSGFTAPEIMLFEITDPRNPRLIKAVTIDGTEDALYRVSFMPSSPGAEYLALGPRGLSIPASVSADAGSRLTGSAYGADYLVITPKEFIEGARSLADYRSRQGRRPLVVEIEDIMDEFNHGIYSPEAISRFLSFTSPGFKNKLRYVVLIGHGTEDYKNLLGFGDNFIPPIMIGTIDGLVPSDNHFADTNGDRIPEMAIGRLPVANIRELQVLIDKIKAYESSSGSWTQNILLLSDYPEAGGNFPADSDTVASHLPPKYIKKKIYLSEQPLGDARRMVLDGINQGALLVNYLGHGGLDRLSQDGLIVSDDVSAMNNAHRLPVMASMTCVIGLFSLPGYDTLAEEMLLKENGGVVAVFSPSGMSVNEEAVILDRELFYSFFQTGQKRTLGEIILEALRRGKESGVSGSLLEQYNLLGDPALLVK